VVFLSVGQGLDFDFEAAVGDAEDLEGDGPGEVDGESVKMIRSLCN